MLRKYHLRNQLLKEHKTSSTPSFSGVTREPILHSTIFDFIESLMDPKSIRFAVWKKRLLFLLFFITNTTSPLQQTNINGYSFAISSLYNLLQQNYGIQYFKCHEAHPFDYKPFPISRFPEQQPNKGMFAETFVAILPHGQACHHYGWIKLDNHIISEYMSQVCTMQDQMQWLSVAPFKNLKKIPGRVAVITRPFSDAFGHWMHDIIVRLALLEMHNIEYDWLYVPTYQPFMNATLQAWGVDLNKIIIPGGENEFIEADELIVPSITSRRIPTAEIPLPQEVLLASYIPQWIITAMRNKFLPKINGQEYNFSKKVFISRQDSTKRMATNENDIFALLEPKGFKRYCLTGMPFLQQVALFNGAQIIVAAHGAALTNLMFSNPGMTLVEIFQERSDATFWYLTQTLNIHHHIIKTCEFKHLCGPFHTHIDPKLIQNFIEKNIELFNQN